MIDAIKLPRFFQHPVLDLKFGFVLMRDRRVPLRSKLAAVLVGLGITALVGLMELPVETILSVLLPILGVVGDVAIDGAEMVAGPLLLGSLLLPYIAPRDVVARIRSERTTPPGERKSPIIDV